MDAQQIFRTIADMRQQVAVWRSQGKSIALVPTMGGLHEGHLALIGAGLSKADRVIVSVFVNPTQFGENEDLDAYPSDWQADLAAITDMGGHGVFLPRVSEIYPEGFSTRVEVDGLTEVLCGLSRPGHFNGVTQVVTKLLNQAQADFAMFGEKDWQQLAVVRRLVRDLDIPTEICGVGVVRDAHGLALSSRNAYLDARELKIARSFNKALRTAASEIALGGEISTACARARAAILDAGFRSVDYVECRYADDLGQVDLFSSRACRIFGAAHLGRARLIDNHLVVTA